MTINVSESENVKGAESQLKQTAPQRVNIDKQPTDKSKNNNSKENRLQPTTPQNNNVANESRLQQTAPQNNNAANESQLKQPVPQTSKGHDNKQSSSSNGNESQLKQTAPQQLNGISNKNQERTTSPPNESSPAENENMEVILSDAQRINTDEQTDCIMSDPSSSTKRKRDLILTCQDFDMWI